MQNSDEPPKVTLEKSSRRTPLRIGIFAFTGIATGALLVVVAIAEQGLTSGEQLSRSLSWALLYIYGLPYLLCVVPALGLALMNRWLPLAAAMCVASFVLLAIMFKTA